jgi:hypothetical protein
LGRDAVKPRWSGTETKEKENYAMTRLNSNLTDATKQQSGENADLDAYIIDDEFDDFRDRELLATREFADVRNL